MGCYVRKRCPRAFGLLHCAMAQRSGADGGAETKADGGRFSGHTAALSRQAKQMYGSASSGTSNGVDRGNESEEMVSEAVARIVHATVDRTETAVKEEEVTTTELEDGSTGKGHARFVGFTGKGQAKPYAKRTECGTSPTRMGRGGVEL